jgi:hypothetical protein
MRGVAFVVLLGLVAGDAVTHARASSEQSSPIEGCLADYGLHRVQ